MLMLFPVADGTTPSDKVVAKGLVRPMNDIKQDAKLHLETVSTSFKTELVELEPIDTESPGFFRFECINRPSLCSNKRTIPGSNQMGLCPLFFDPVSSTLPKGSLSESQLEFEIQEAVTKSIEKDTKDYQATTSNDKDKAQFPLPVNPGEHFYYLY